MNQSNDITELKTLYNKVKKLTEKIDRHFMSIEQANEG